ncbi:MULTISPECIES: Ppx/GppA phosphatase family protein [unclassified Adlercreutzia]|uniref:Ppx/GppA phosphatase family protein n=1 Tax=unclassified Adlercreutzia TaxID=2636013 RepID=UPI0013ED7A88|nr:MULTISPECIES: Ppx/GppA phosphatase family protein [unclassified Adlercreutzia]
MDVQGAQRFAAIDIGTVTCRMLVADVAGGRVVPLAKEYAITNLGEGVDASGELKAEAMERVARTIDRYCDVRDALSTPEHPVLKTVCVATSAARDARNASEFARMLADRGLELAVIPGEQEAALSFAGASAEFPGERILVVDVGGGSTELIVGLAGGVPQKAHSFDIGCRRVTERFLASDPPAALELSAARAWCAEQFAAYFEELPEGARPDRMVAVAGTATTAVSIREGMETYDSDRVHGARVSLEELEGITRRLAALPLEERAQVVGLDPGRAPVITAGLLILEEVMRAAGVGAFTASESDILQGMLLRAAQG